MELCNKNCNECPIILHPNSRILTKIFNQLYTAFGEEMYHIVQSNCPNLTCCYDCHIDDFCHFESCKILKKEN